MVLLVATGNGMRLRGHEFEALEEDAVNLVKFGYATYKSAKTESVLEPTIEEIKPKIVKPSPKKKGRKPNKK